MASTKWFCPSCSPSNNDYRTYIMWIIQPLELADQNGNPTGRWRLTAKSDEGGGGPFGDTSHDHATADEAVKCDRCDEYCHHIAGFRSTKETKQDVERAERVELERLKAKYDGPNNTGGQPHKPGSAQSSSGQVPGSAPWRIWLQWNGDSDESEDGEPSVSDVTWCRDKVFDRDVEYIRADLAVRNKDACDHEWEYEDDSSDVEPSRPYYRCRKCDAEKDYEPPSSYEE